VKVKKVLGRFDKALIRIEEEEKNKKREKRSTKETFLYIKY
jgi:hypothetical protein